MTQVTDFAVRGSSAYATAMNTLGRKGIGADVPLEVVAMLAQAAETRGVKMVTILREAFVEKANASRIMHEVTCDSPNCAPGVTHSELWQYDIALLDPKAAAKAAKERAEAQAKATAEKEAKDLEDMKRELAELRAFKEAQERIAAFKASQTQKAASK